MENHLSFRDKPSWRSLLFEFFIAISLSAAFFFLVKPYIIIGNPINRYIFTSGSENFYRLDQPIMGGLWNGRLGALLVSGAVVDFSVNGGDTTTAQKMERLSNAFGLYHTFWLFLTFVVVMFLMRRSLLVNFGILAGLMYDFSPASGPYFYPWDLSAMFFCTVAALLFARRHIWLMAAVTCAGCFFKETVLVCALFVFFVGDWKWGKRIGVFIGIVALYFFAKEILLSNLNLHAAMSSPADAFASSGALSPAALFTNFAANLKALFSPALNSVIFVNGGTLVATLFLGWQKRFIPYMTIICAFILGTFLTAPPPGISEVRDFMQVLPLCLIILSELCEQLAAARDGSGQLFSGVKLVTRVSIPAFLSLGLILVCFCISARQYGVIYGDLNSFNSPQGKLGTSTLDFPAIEGNQILAKHFTDDELELGSISALNGNLPDALNRYQNVLKLDPESVQALNDLAWLRATAPDEKLRNGTEAIRLAEQACRLTKYQQPIAIGTLAAAYAEDGQFNEAVLTSEKAIEIAQANGETNVLQKNRELLQLYQANKPYRQEWKK